MLDSKTVTNPNTENKSQDRHSAKQFAPGSENSELVQKFNQLNKKFDQESRLNELSRSLDVDKMRSQLQEACEVEHPALQQGTAEDQVQHFTVDQEEHAKAAPQRFEWQQKSHGKPFS